MIFSDEYLMNYKSVTKEGLHWNYFNSKYISYYLCDFFNCLQIRFIYCMHM